MILKFKLNLAFLQNWSLKKKLFLLVLTLSLPSLFFVTLVVRDLYTEKQKLKHYKYEISFLGHIIKSLSLFNQSSLSTLKPEVLQLGIYSSLVLNNSTEFDSIIHSISNIDVEYLSEDLQNSKDEIILFLKEISSKDTQKKIESFNDIKFKTLRLYNSIQKWGSELKLLKNKNTFIQKRSEIILQDYPKVLNLETDLLFYFIEYAKLDTTKNRDNFLNILFQLTFVWRNIINNADFLDNQFDENRDLSTFVKSTTDIVNFLSRYILTHQKMTENDIICIKSLLHVYSKRTVAVQNIFTYYIFNDMERFSKSNSSKLYSSIILRILVLCFGFWFASFIYNQLKNSLEEILATYKELSTGKLTHSFHVTRQDEFGTLQLAYNILVDSLKKLITATFRVYEQATEHSNEIVKDSKVVLKSGQEQVAFLEEASAAIEELSASTQSILDAAKKQLVDIQKNNTSMQDIQKAFISIDAIQDKIRESASHSMTLARKGGDDAELLAKTIGELSEITELILGITDVIKDIADQTALLALNASIEAARAGKHGQGFAVVAQEITDLADRCADSSKEINNLLETASQTTTKSVSMVEQNKKMFYEIIGSMQDLVGNLAEVKVLEKLQLDSISQSTARAKSNAALAKEILDATSLQSQSAEEITSDMSRTNDIISVNVERLETLDISLQSLLKEIQEGHSILRKFEIN